MKIHILNLHLSRLGGGIFTVIKELYLSKHFANSTYSKMHFWSYEDNFSSSDSYDLQGVCSLFSVYLKSLNKIYYSAKLKQVFLSEVSENDIIHLHSLWLYLSIVISIAQKRKKAKKIISTHGMLDRWALSNGKIKKKLALNLFERRNLNTADCIHALCFQEYMDIRKIAPEKPVAIIPNGINLPIRINRPPNKNKNTLLFISRIHPKKGLINLIKAWSKLKPNHWQLKIAGPNENNHLEELLEIVRNLNLTHQIVFTGAKYGDDKIELLESADALILPSLSEGLPMVILEAWSYKLPVLMTPECNLPDGFETNSAIKIEANSESIAEGLVKLFAMNETELEKMGTNGYKLVTEKYTWDSVAKQMIQLYDWVSDKIEKPDFVKLD